MGGGPLLALVGPTATGKTEAALSLADPLHAEVVSVDSMLLYRGMDLGTAKPTALEREAVPHHLVDVADPSEAFSAARYQREAREAIDGIERRGHRALLVGGSGLYFRALVDELELPGTDERTRRELEDEARAVGPAALYRRLEGSDPKAAAKIEPGNLRRTVRALEVAAITGRVFSSYAESWERYPAGLVRAAGVTMPPDLLAERIRRRVRDTLEAGWLAEVQRLVDRGFGGWLTATQAIGYAELAAHLQGGMSLEAAVEATVRRTRNLARRQLAWFRRDPRIRWFETGSEGAIRVVESVRQYLEGE